MPIIRIEVRRHYSEAEAQAIMQAVHVAVCEAFQLPMTDRNVRLLTHPAQQFLAPDTLEHSERFTQVTVDAFSGRSVETKRKLYRLIVEQLERLGIPRNHVHILLRESPRENWGIRGGQMASDVELGFRVDV